MKTSSLIGRFISTVYCMLFLLCLVYTVVVCPGIFFFELVPFEKKDINYYEVKESNNFNESLFVCMS